MGHGGQHGTCGAVHQIGFEADDVEATRTCRRDHVIAGEVVVQLQRDGCIVGDGGCSARCAIVVQPHFHTACGGVGHVAQQVGHAERASARCAQQVAIDQCLCVDVGCLAGDFTDRGVVGASLDVDSVNG